VFHRDFGGDAKRTLDALSGSSAIIAFEPIGEITRANENSRRTLGYDLAEIEGERHGRFAGPACAASGDDAEFRAELGRGELDAREYKRLTPMELNCFHDVSIRPADGRGSMA
jgi:methyl-accepting chemotaxis protein